MKTLIPFLAFAVRHFLAVVFLALAGSLLWTAVYLLWLGIAVLGNSGVGGPLAYPAGILAVVLTCLILGWGVFAPASGVGSIVCRVFRWPMLAAIPVVFGIAFVLSYLLYGAYIEWVTTHPMTSGWIVLKNFSIFLSVPLGIYWWMTEGPGALFDAFLRWLKSRPS